MIALVRAEFRKLLTTQVWFWLLLGSLTVTGLLLWGEIAGSSQADLQDHVRDVFTSAFNPVVPGAYIAAFVLGVLVITTETRYQTITPTLLVTPNRWIVVAAKMILCAIVGIVYSAACTILTVVMAVPWLKSRHVDASFGPHHVWTGLLGVFVIYVLFALFGLGLGALVRNQIVAVTVGVISLVILQTIVLAIPGVRHAYPYLPNAASFAILSPHNDFGNGIHLLSVAGGVVVMLLWAFVTAVIGAGYSLNRDIT
jgi:ABC-2 type transport system permease protein